MIGVSFSRSCGDRRDTHNVDSLIQDKLHMRWRFCGRATSAGWSCTTTSIGYRRPISTFADDGCSLPSCPPTPNFPLLLARIDGAHLGYPFSTPSRPRYSHILRYEKAQHDPATNGTTDVLLGNYTELWKVLHNCQRDLLLIVRAQDLTNGGYSVRAMDWAPEHGLDMIPLVDETDARLSHTPYFTFHRHHRVACL